MAPSPTMPSVLPASSSPAQLHVRLQGIEPPAARDVVMTFRDTPRQGQHQPKGVFRHGLGVPSRGVDDCDSAGRGGVHVDVVGRGPANPNELEIRDGLEHLLEDEVQLYHQHRGPQVVQLRRELVRVVQPPRVHPARVLDVEPAGQTPQLPLVEGRQEQPRGPGGRSGCAAHLDCALPGRPDANASENRPTIQNGAGMNSLSGFVRPIRVFRLRLHPAAARVV